MTVQGGDKTVQKISIDKMPTRLDYQVGDSFDSSGMVLRVTTDQGDELVRSGFTCSPSRFTREGLQIVTVSYGSRVCTLELTITAGEAKPEPTKTPASKDEPEDPSVPDRQDEGRRGDSRSQRATSTMLMVIIFTALVALVALIAYLYVTKKDELIALWQQLLSRFGRGGRE